MNNRASSNNIIHVFWGEDVVGLESQFSESGVCKFKSESTFNELILFKEHRTQGDS